MTTADMFFNTNAGNAHRAEPPAVGPAPPAVGPANPPAVGPVNPGPVVHAPSTEPAPTETHMSTVPVVISGLATPGAVAPAIKKENALERFIDKLVPFLKKAGPVLLEGAELARPFLALTPIGPEYNIALTGIETAISADQAMQANSATPLTGLQKMAVAVTVSSPVLEQILSTKGIKEPDAVKNAIAQFLQNVYNLQTGPVSVPAAA